MSDTTNDADKADAAADAELEKAAADRKAAHEERAKAAKAEADRIAALPPPVEFHAQDRYHAMSHVKQGLHHIKDETKAALHAALEGMTHMGPVHVQVPAPPATPGTPAPAADAPADPTAPKDGAFLVRPYHYIAV